MSKKPSLDEFILTELEKGALIGINLKDNVIARLPDEKKPKRRNKTFDESLMRLMDNDKILIVNYVKSTENERRQNFKSDYLIYGLLKTDPVMIMDVILKLDSEDLEEKKKAKNELKSRFFKKIKSIDVNELMGLKYLSYREIEYLFNDLFSFLITEPGITKNKQRLADGLSGIDQADTGLYDLLKQIPSFSEYVR